MRRETDEMKRDLIKTEEDVAHFLRDKSQFEREVLLATFKIPKGKVSTYRRIAEKIGRPRAYRAVGNALHKNPLAPIVPCHRVVTSNGTFSGDEKGAAYRRRSLEKERIPIEKGRVVMSEDIVF